MDADAAELEDLDRLVAGTTGGRNDVFTHFPARGGRFIGYDAAAAAPSNAAPTAPLPSSSASTVSERSRYQAMGASSRITRSSIASGTPTAPAGNLTVSGAARPGSVASRSSAVSRPLTRPPEELTVSVAGSKRRMVYSASGSIVSGNGGPVADADIARVGRKPAVPNSVRSGGAPEPNSGTSAAWGRVSAASPNSVGMNSAAPLRMGSTVVNLQGQARSLSRGSGGGSAQLHSPPTHDPPHVTGLTSNAGVLDWNARRNHRTSGKWRFSGGSGLDEEPEGGDDGDDDGGEEGGVGGEERRLKKNDRERQRRMEVNEAFAALADIVHVDRRNKSDKTSVLVAACTEITALRARVLELEAVLRPHSTQGGGAPDHTTSAQRAARARMGVGASQSPSTAVTGAAYSAATAMPAATARPPAAAVTLGGSVAGGSAVATQAPPFVSRGIPAAYLGAHKGGGHVQQPQYQQQQQQQQQQLLPSPHAHDTTRNMVAPPPPPTPPNALLSGNTRYAQAPSLPRSVSSASGGGGGGGGGGGAPAGGSASSSARSSMQSGGDAGALFPAPPRFTAANILMSPNATFPAPTLIPGLLDPSFVSPNAPAADAASRSAASSGSHAVGGAAASKSGTRTSDRTSRHSEVQTDFPSPITFNPGATIPMFARPRMYSLDAQAALLREVSAGSLGAIAVGATDVAASGGPASATGLMPASWDWSDVSTLMEPGVGSATSAPAEGLLERGGGLPSSRRPTIAYEAPPAARVTSADTDMHPAAAPALGAGGLLESTTDGADLPLLMHPTAAVAAAQNADGEVSSALGQFAFDLQMLDMKDDVTEIW